MNIKDEKKVEEKVYDNTLGTEFVEAPKYSCALAGAYATALGVYGLVPLLHAGLGCGLGQLFGQLYAGGQNAGGPLVVQAHLQQVLLRNTLSSVVKISLEG